MKVVAGVDCHRDAHAIVFVDEVGKVVSELTIGTSDQEFARATAVAASLGSVIWGLESTGSYGRRLPCFWSVQAL